MNDSPNGRLSAAEVRRIDQLAAAEQRRVDGLLAAQETAVNAALAAAEKAVAAALAASEKAVNKAEVAQQRVNETQNEFRGTLSDQAKNLMPRNEAESLNRELRALIQAQLTQIGELRSRLDVGPPSLAVLQARSDTDAGQKQGAGATVYWIALAIGVIGTIFGIVGTILALT